MIKGWTFRVLLMGVMVFIMFSAGQITSVGTETSNAKEVSGQNPETGVDPQDLDVILINYEGYKKDRKGPVSFSHKKHATEYRIFCWECHHDYRDGENVWVGWGETKKCFQCHDPQKKEPTDIMLQKAFHYNCKGCHRELARKKKISAEFDKCGGCHIKKEEQ